MQFDSLDYLLEVRDMIFIEKELCEQILEWLELKRLFVYEEITSNPRSDNKNFLTGCGTAYTETIKYIKQLMNE